jgi:adhesin/invasin
VETTLNDTTAETVTVHGSVVAGTIPSDSDVTFTAGSVDATASGFVVYRSAGNTNPSKVRADGIESWTGEFTPKDAGGNTITQPLAPSVLAELTVVVDARVTVSAGPAGTYTWLFTSETYDVDFDVQLFMGTTKVAPMTTNTIAYTRAVAPEAPVITEPAPGEDINTTTPTVSGENGEPGSTITVTDEDGNVLCTVTAGADGSWSCTVEIPLDEGDHTITVTATDSAGNESEADSIEIIVKTVPPTVPVLNPTNGSKVTGWTDADTLITITDAAGKPIVGCIDIEPTAAGDFTCWPKPMVAAGQTIKAVATDRAGNESKVATVVVRGLSSGVTHPERYVGEEQVVTGYNFNPGETVTLVVFSDPLEVGPAVADGDGTVTWTFTIPGDMEVTVHTAMLTGVESGSITTTFEVMAKPVTPEPPAAPEAPAPVVVPTGGVILPSAVLPLALVILGALLALGFVVTTRNRRSTDN